MTSGLPSATGLPKIWWRQLQDVCTSFELLLRLKANYLWPAMWASAFNEDDPMNPILADEYGIVMGTSHHEPMMRAHKEYTRRKEEVGPWDYKTNKERLDNFSVRVWNGIKTSKMS